MGMIQCFETEGICGSVVCFQVNFPMCTIASMPRLPEHCVEYVRILQWPKEKPFGGSTFFSLCDARYFLLRLFLLLHRSCVQEFTVGHIIRNTLYYLFSQSWQRRQQQHNA